MLHAARKLLGVRSPVEPDRMGFYSGSVVLSRTALDAFSNESMLTLLGDSPRKQYRDFLSLHISTKFKRLYALTSIPESTRTSILQEMGELNRIRNYCVHNSPGGDLDATIVARFVGAEASLVGDTTDRIILTQPVAAWCLGVVAKTITDFERSRRPRTGMSDFHIEVCKNLGPSHGGF